MSLLPLGDASVLTSFTPLLVAVFSPLLLGEAPSRCSPQVENAQRSWPASLHMPRAPTLGLTLSLTLTRTQIAIGIARQCLPGLFWTCLVMTRHGQSALKCRDAASISPLPRRPGQCTKTYMGNWTLLLCWRRAVLVGVPVCIAAVALVARPSFLFGGEGLRPKGVAVAVLQVSSYTTTFIGILIFGTLTPRPASCTPANAAWMGGKLLRPQTMSLPPVASPSASISMPSWLVVHRLAPVNPDEEATPL